MLACGRKGFVEHTFTSVVNGESVTTVSPLDTWSAADKELGHANAMALNVINYGISPEEFKSIMTCETTKPAWDVLELSVEGTTKVNDSKLQILTIQFERMKMEDTETFGDF